MHTGLGFLATVWKGDVLPELRWEQESLAGKIHKEIPGGASEDCEDCLEELAPTLYTCLQVCQAS